MADVQQRSARASWTATAFSTWIILGLYLDGWAHNAGRPEDFWTPWHAVLYSGFVAATAWFLFQRRRGDPGFADRLTVAGFALFAIAGVGDAVWHTLLGIEEDLAALISPTHLALMVGGLLLVASPIRASRRDPAPDRGWRGSAPTVISVGLSVAVIAFFLQFVSAFHLFGLETFTVSNVPDDSGATIGIASILLTNLLLLGGVAWVANQRTSSIRATSSARRDVPPGTYTLVMAVPALLLSSLHAFEHAPLVLAAILGGATADVLSRAGHGRRMLLLAVPAVTWATWFAVFHGIWGLGWEAELWTGSIVLTVLTGAGMDLLVQTRPQEERVSADRVVREEHREPRTAAVPVLDPGATSV
ncbi:MAG: hypothetical protein KY437_00915 [Actinobacteria bacterium]|nr:hypothetical protein [Actinomycetota bacterium]